MVLSIAAELTSFAIEGANVGLMINPPQTGNAVAVRDTESLNRAVNGDNWIRFLLALQGSQYPILTSRAEPYTADFGLL